MAEDTPQEIFALRLFVFLVSVLIITALIMIGMLSDDGKDLGPCEQYQNQEAFELCADSVYNG